MSEHRWKPYLGKYPGITATCGCGATQGERKYKADKPCNLDQRMAEFRECEKCCFVRISGQGFTDYVCRGCKQTISHGNTSVPMFCRECSIKLNCCRRCGGDLPKAPARPTPKRVRARNPEAFPSNDRRSRG